MSRKQLTINVVANIVSFVISSAISFLLSPYIINTVGKEAYGFVGLANNFVEYASLITIALNSMGARFITIKIHQNDIEGANKYFNSILIANLVMALFMMVPSIITVVFMNNIVNIPIKILLDVQLLWALIFFNFIVSLVTSTFGVATFAKNRLDLSSFLSIKSNLLRAIILVTSFLVFKPYVWFIGLASICCTIYISINNIRYTKELLPELKINKNYYNENAIIELISAGIWNTVTKMGSILSSGLDLLIANIFISSSAMGILSISKIIPTMILSISGMLSSIFAPNFTVFYAKNNMDELKKELLTSMKFLGIIMSIPLAGLLAYGGIFYSLWLPKENSQLLHILSSVCVVGMIFGASVESLYNVFTITNKLKGNSIFNFSCSILTAIIVFTSMNIIQSDFIGMFIITGVSTIFSIIRNTIFLPIYAAKCLGFKWNVFYSPIIKNVVSTIIITIISLVLIKVLRVDSWIMIIISASITIVIGLGINCLMILTKNEREIIFNKLKIMIKG